MGIEQLAKADRVTPEDRAFYRQVLKLRKQGLGWREIAAEFGEPQTTIYTRAVRLHDRIRAARKR